VLQVHVFFPGPVSVQVAFVSHPPLLVEHESIAVHVVPAPEYPVLQEQEFVPGPVLVHVASAEHPPLLVAHELIAVHVVPFPE